MVIYRDCGTYVYCGVCEGMGTLCKVGDGYIQRLWYLRLMWSLWGNGGIVWNWGWLYTETVVLTFIVVFVRECGALCKFGVGYIQRLWYLRLLWSVWGNGGHCVKLVMVIYRDCGTYVYCGVCEGMGALCEIGDGYIQRLWYLRLLWSVWGNVGLCVNLGMVIYRDCGTYVYCGICEGMGGIV